MVEKLQELGYPIDFDRVREIAGGDTIARPHVGTGAWSRPASSPNEKAAFTEEFIVRRRSCVGAEARRCIRWTRSRSIATGGRRLRAGPSGHVEGRGSVPDELIERDGRRRHGRARGRPSGPRRDPAGEVPRDGGAAWTSCRPARPIVTGARYDPVRLGSETTGADRFAELRRPRRGLTSERGWRWCSSTSAA